MVSHVKSMPITGELACRSCLKHDKYKKTSGTQSKDITERMFEKTMS